MTVTRYAETQLVPTVVSVRRATEAQTGKAVSVRVSDRYGLHP